VSLPLPAAGLRAGRQFSAVRSSSQFICEATEGGGRSLWRTCWTLLFILWINTVDLRLPAATQMTASLVATSLASAIFLRLRPIWCARHGLPL